MDNKMAEQVLFDVLQELDECTYSFDGRKRMEDVRERAMKVVGAALYAPRVPVAWMVTRDRDKTFPRLYVEKDLAERLVSFVGVNPPAVLHPLYVLTTSPEPVADSDQ